MAENVLKKLTDRKKFIDQLNKDILENTDIIEQAEAECKEINNIIENVTMLGIYPEKEALIPLSKKFYMKGKITHTGEHHFHKTAHPYSYVFLKTLNQTVTSLKEEIEEKEKDIENAKLSLFQLEERKRILIGDQDLTVSEINDDLPDTIVSDKGVAVKVGDYYEILEYDT